MPSSLLCNWQKSLAQATLLDPELDLEGSNKKLSRFDIWKHSYLKTCASVDQELEHHRKIDSYYSGTTALTIVRQVKQKNISYLFIMSTNQWFLDEYRVKLFIYQM